MAHRWESDGRDCVGATAKPAQVGLISRTRTVRSRPETLRMAPVHSIRIDSGADACRAMWATRGLR